MSMKKDKVKISTNWSKDTKIIGDVFAEENMNIEGHITGNIHSQGDIIVGATAVITGNVVGREVIVSGVICGDIKASETVTLTSKGKIEGNVQTTGFVVDIGSYFSGNCTILDKENATIPIHQSETPAKNSGKSTPAPATDEEISALVATVTTVET